MIVYGDPQFNATAAGLLRALREKLNGVTENNLDQLRTVLIEAGQMEQAIEDRSLEAWAPASRRITDCAAAAFCSAHGTGWMNKADLLKKLRQAVCDASGFHDEQITVKIPEGFEFYALYPEQYCLAALEWHRENLPTAPDFRVLVAGVRSIGTTLSAVVAATLAAADWKTSRITVRPHGPPFARATTLPVGIAGCARRAIVVDEGPGLSGSSMASVAWALEKNGFAPEQISFMPGHGNEPGPAALEEVRSKWRSVRRHVKTFDDLRWSNMSLPAFLRKKSAELLHVDRRDVAIEDLSCGRWRKKLFSNSSDWPWAAIPFERMKFLCATQKGGAIFWKFTGFRCLPDFRGAEWRAQRAGWFHGFTARRWISGKPLSVKEGSDPSLVRDIALHIAAVSKPPLSEAEQTTSFGRIREMLYWNAKEALGDVFAERGRQLAGNLQFHQQLPAYGDGRLAPHEWIRTSEGRIMKVDAAGHDADHTVVGNQPVYWDVAGAMVEWRLDSAEILLCAIEERGIFLEPGALTFYCAAYAAFRTGQAFLCAQNYENDVEEHTRTMDAFEYYRESLMELLMSNETSRQSLTHSRKLSLAQTH